MWWSLLVYGIAALWGLRLLFALMAQHRRQYLEKLHAEHVEQAPDQSPGSEPAQPPKAAA
uniref:CcmD family protein n=1 Tax=Schlesneria paludicola TaxID=360056 RepID=A0A7C4QPJ0_9PLAN